MKNSPPPDFQPDRRSVAWAPSLVQQHRPTRCWEDSGVEYFLKRTSQDAQDTRDTAWDQVEFFKNCNEEDTVQFGGGTYGAFLLATLSLTIRLSMYEFARRAWRRCCGPLPVRSWRRPAFPLMLHAISGQNWAIPQRFNQDLSNRRIRRPGESLREDE